MTITTALFFHSALLPFHMSVLTIFILIIGETIGMYIKHRPSQLIRQMVPMWLRDAPLLQVQISRFIILLFFLINFSFAGYLIQLSAFAFSGDFVHTGFVLIPALLMAWFFTLFMMHCLDQVIKPTQSNQQVILLGRFATIVSGTARPGSSAQAKVRDQFGRLHYVQVEPEFGELILQSKVILVDYRESQYIAKAIVNSEEYQFGLEQK